MDSKGKEPDKRNSFVWFLSRCFHDDHKTIPIREKCLTLGRGDSVGYQFCPKKYHYLSRNHCAVQIIDGKPTITDCNSARGTFVNSKRLDKFSPGQIVLNEGDHVGIGHKNDEIQQYFKFHENILKYRVCRRIGDDEAIIISDEEGETTSNSEASAEDAYAVQSCIKSSPPVKAEVENVVPKAASPVPGPSGLRISSCMSISMDLLKNSSFEEEYDLCANRFSTPMGYESDTEAASPGFNNSDVIVLSDDDEYVALQHTQTILEEIKKDLECTTEEASNKNINEETTNQWALKLKPDIDARQRYKKKSIEHKKGHQSTRKENDSSRKENDKNDAGSKSIDKHNKHRKSSEQTSSTDKIRIKQSESTEEKPPPDVPLKISLKRSTNDCVMSNESTEETKQVRMSLDTAPRPKQSSVGGGLRKRTVEGGEGKTLIQEQTKRLPNRRHSVADWRELEPRQRNGIIELTPPEHYTAKGGSTHRTRPLSLDSGPDPKPSGEAHSSHGARESSHKNSKPALKRRSSISSREEMQAMIRKKMKPHYSVSDPIFDFQQIPVVSKEQREQRKTRLMEVTMNKKRQEQLDALKDDTTVPMVKKTGTTKPKVKFTPNNRGSFLTATVPPPPPPLIRAVSTSRPASTDESIVCTQSTALELLPGIPEEQPVVDMRPKKLTFEGVARVSNVDRPLPNGSAPSKIAARRNSVLDYSKILKPSAALPAKKPSTGAITSTISDKAQSSKHKPPEKTVSTSISNSIPGVHKPNSFYAPRMTVTPEATIVKKRPLRSILKPYNFEKGANAIRKSVTIMETLNKTRLIEKIVYSSKNVNTNVSTAYVQEQARLQEDKLIVEILQWPTGHLMRQESSEYGNSFPFAADDKIPPKLDSYDEYESFWQIHAQFLKRELWKEICNNAREMSLFLTPHTLKCHENQELCELECEVPLRIIEHVHCPAFDFGVLEYNIAPHQKASSFFYIKKQETVKWNGELGCHNSSRTPEQAIKYILVVSKAELKRLKVGCQFVLRPIIRIHQHLRQWCALHVLQYSQLLDNILTPAFNVQNVLTIAQELQQQPANELTNVAKHLEAGALNPCQMRVVSSVLEECRYDDLATISIIQGPPGTGKSRVISHLVLELMRVARSDNVKMKVLVCAASNTAVDVIVKKLLNLKKRTAQTKNLKLVRTGARNKVDPSCMQVFIDSLVQEKVNPSKAQRSNNATEPKKQEKRTKDEIKAYIKIISEADIVCTTLGSCSMLPYCETLKFNVCIVDEATQCTELCTLLPLQYHVSKLVMVGDVNQLPATVLDQQSAEAGYRKSLFTRLYQSYVDSSETKVLKVLNTQYRMHPEICHWPNGYFYHSQLKSAPCTEANRKDIPLKPYMVISLNYDQELTQAQYEIYNKDEIRFVVGLVKQMVRACDKHASFAIITPYSRHKEELRKTLHLSQLERVEAHSIDSVQGKEFDVVVISLARSNGTGFLDQPERINVALTRARQCLVLCGNFSSLKYKPVWSSLLADAQKRKVYYELEDHDAHVYSEQMVENIMQRLRKN
ncbi:uncharacterized protein LOC126561352 [Anopheles maculipalpis]|uniref:uncharacterized protein LOC126561352 n=1 Tax=Anopheles maculipalpis TaxID=1496333 RepID=UPI002158F2D7|nr:uncharacterized protein LOC126561352 [Anopheles maculipalpis]